VPRAGDELLGAVLGGVTWQRVKLGGLAGGAEEGFGIRRWLGAGEFSFHPGLGGSVLLPVGEEADAVAGRKDMEQAVLEFVEREVFVDGLDDLEGGLEVERETGDDAKRAERDYGSGEDVGVCRSGKVKEFAASGDEVDRADGCREALVGNAGAVRCGGAGSGYGYVWQ